LPSQVKEIHARADSGFCCWDAIEAYERNRCQFIVCTRKTSQLADRLKAAEWKSSPKTDADGQCEFRYQPAGWGKEYRFIALRYRRKPKAKDEQKPEQYQLFDTPEYSYRVFVTNMKDPVELLVWFYGQRGGAENLIKEANNDAGLTAHPSGRFETNRNYFQLSMLAYNLNCRLMLFNREEGTSSETLRHTTLQTARLRFLFLAAKIWRHAGRVGVSYWSIRLSEESFPNDGIHRYSDHYEEKNILQRLMDRVRSIAAGADGFLPVLKTGLT